jgi:hypothetical protein
MTKLRLLPTIMFTAALLLPAVATNAQDEADASVTPEAIAAGDTRIDELRALVPETLAGLPLRENLQVATGEQLVQQMSDQERALFEAMLEANGATLADYAAANAFVPITDTTAVLVQPHRVTGIDAAATIDTWVELLSLNAAEPEVSVATVSGHDVTLFSDAAQPDFPLLHLFAAGDVVWMMVAEDEALIEEAVAVLAADGDEVAAEG